MTDEELRVAREAKELFAGGLLGNADVHGVGVGRRRRGGEKTEQYAVVVHVARKLPREQVPADRLVPRELRFTTRDGQQVVVPIDVQQRPVPVPEAGPAALPDLRSRLRPVPGGCSAGTGTLGGWVWDTVTGQPVALSNEHVFGSVAGAAVTQPSSGDGGLLPADRIGTVLRAGQLDAAIAAPDDPALVDGSVPGTGPAVLEIADATVDMRVRKCGKTTGLTAGVVDLVDYDIGHHGSGSDLWVDGEDGDFSAGGDSGALYVEATHPDPAATWLRVVGLHWGGAGDAGVGHHIRAVFADLGLAPLDPALVLSPATARPPA
jgi:hypothetical protein